MTMRQAQRKAALWFLEGKSAGVISKHLHMARSVVDKWKSDVRFVDMMSELEIVQNEVAEYRLRALKRQAVVVLAKALKSTSPKEYQWAVAKLFTLPQDLLTAPSFGHAGLLTPEADMTDDTLETQSMPPQAAAAHPQAAAAPGDRKSLMEFLDATRAMDQSKTPVPGPVLN